MNMKKIAILALSLCMIAAVAVTGTIAYFTDTDEQTNTFTVGNVQIEQKEFDENGNQFEQNQDVSPIINAGDKYNDPNYIHKNISVKNTGKNDAWVRTFVAIPVSNGNSTDYNASNNWLHWNGYDDSDDGDATAWNWSTEGGETWPGNAEGWNEYYAEIEGEMYRVMIVTNEMVLGAGNETHPHFRGFFLDSSVNYDDNGYFYTKNGERIDLGDISNLKIYAHTQAVQADGFDTAWEAFETANLEYPWPEWVGEQ